MNDPFHLSRFVTAQQPVYDDVVRELASGQKRSHWMWFVFPQVRGLGFSAMAQQYAIGSREEAAAYLQHKVLGARLLKCTQLVLNVTGRSVDEIFGSPDNMKFRSSMTLFAAVALDCPTFGDALSMYFAGEPDPLTQAILDQQ